MEPSSNIVTLIDGTTVEIIEKLNWGQQEKIRTNLYSGLKVRNIQEGENGAVDFDATSISRAKYKTIEVCVKKITKPDGNVVQYSVEWLDNLEVEDGDAIYRAVQAVTQAKKK
jgi:hypothetical protein